ncbi:hypothetical protein MJO29_006009 [Puccinia striiformis f. sp. tritici]|nr:hypothetical protein MJO29_006009 [Puccinia striiformis f. sp. tritici]
MPGSIGNMAIPVPALKPCYMNYFLNTWILPTKIGNILTAHLVITYFTLPNPQINSNNGHVDSSNYLPYCDLPATRLQRLRHIRSEYTIAYLKIRYESDSTLDVFETNVEKISGNCVIMVEKPYDVKITQQTIEGAFAKMLSHCKEHPGTYVLPGYEGVKLSTRLREPLPRIEDDTPLDTPICHDSKDRSNPEHCAKAFSALHADGQKQFVEPSGAPTNIAGSTVKSCDVVIFSTDGSALDITKEDARAIFYRIVSTCNGKWGAISLETGVDGRNGRLVVLLRPTGK